MKSRLHEIFPILDAPVFLAYRALHPFMPRSVCEDLPIAFYDLCGDATLARVRRVTDE
jgi:hypothetical protein